MRINWINLECCICISWEILKLLRLNKDKFTCSALDCFTLNFSIPYINNYIAFSKSDTSNFSNHGSHFKNFSRIALWLFFGNDTFIIFSDSRGIVNNIFIIIVLLISIAGTEKWTFISQSRFFERWWVLYCIRNTYFCL